MPTILFNLALHYLVEKLGNKRHLLFRTKQLGAYADDVVLVVRNVKAFKKMFQKLDVEARKINLWVNESNKKYIKFPTYKEKRRVQDIEVGGFKFQGVTKFSYLGTNLNIENKISREIQNRIMSGNRVYNVYQNLLKSKLLSQKNQTLDCVK